MSQFDYELFYERNLPHYQPQGATFFITFRLTGSLPKEIIDRLLSEAATLKGDLKKPTDSLDSSDHRRKLQNMMFSRWDSELDANGSGPRYLEDNGIAKVVMDAIHFLDGKQYILEAYSIMPNHVHIVYTPMITGTEYFSNAKILHGLKRFTAKEANLMLGRQGQFWQHESYDHAVRDEGELDRIIQYVLQNPVKAGLGKRWVYSRTSNDE